MTNDQLSLFRMLYSICRVCFGFVYMWKDHVFTLSSVCHAIIVVVMVVAVMVMMVVVMEVMVVGVVISEPRTQVSKSLTIIIQPIIYIFHP